MKKSTPAFTLIELLISVFLLGLIVNFLYTAIGNLQKTNMMFNSKSQSHINEQKVLDLLYDDIFLADDLKITKILKNSFVEVETKNSLFDIEHPYVTWQVSKEKDTLIRYESSQPFKSMNSDNSYLYHISKAGEDCERFNVYLSKDKNNILINIKFKDKEPLIYEFFKPLSIKKDTNKSNKSNLRKNPLKPTH
jgi:prepilin-type N-terminal cleavage/methylation domain-containing protein